MGRSQKPKSQNPSVKGKGNVKFCLLSFFNMSFVKGGGGSYSSPYKFCRFGMTPFVEVGALNQSK